MENAAEKSSVCIFSQRGYVNIISSIVLAFGTYTMCNPGLSILMAQIGSGSVCCSFTVLLSLLFVSDAWDGG